MNISMNIRHLDMVESSAAEYSAAEVAFLTFRAQYSAEEAPRFKQIYNRPFRPIDRLAVLCMDICHLEIDK